ncbi:MAG TPA: hypothetical protein VGC30_07895 [Dokdonella sp.]
MAAQPIYAVTFAGERLLVGGGMTFGSQYLGLYASDDLGQSWTSLSDDWPLAAVNAVAVDPGDPDTILAATGGAGVNRSSDGGATWEYGVAGTTALTTTSVRFVPGDGTRVLVGATSLAVFESNDAGETFAQAADGISELALYSIAANPANPAELAAAFQGLNNGGVFSSTDGGTTWRVEDALPPTRYSKIGFAPDGTLYAISDGPTTVAQEGLYRREADDNWTNLGPDQGEYFESDLDAMRFSVNDPNLIVLGGADFGVAGWGGTVWRSIDAGATWDKVYLGPDYDKITDLEIVEDGTDRQIVAVYDSTNGGDQQGGAIRSGDGGATWAFANAGLPTFARIPRLCQTSDDAHALYLSAATTTAIGSVFRSDDGAASWTPTGWDDTNLILDIACDPLQPGTLYVARNGSQGYVERSDDGGASFVPYAAGLDAAGTPSELIAVGSGGETRLLLATLKGSFAEGGGPADRIFADGFDP